MTKADILQILECSQAELARLLGISRSAVAQWPPGEPIPERQFLRLKHELRPDLFSAQTRRQDLAPETARA